MDRALALRSLRVLVEIRRGTEGWPVDGEKRHARADDIVLSYLRFHEPELYAAYMALVETASFWAYA